MSLNLPLKHQAADTTIFTVMSTLAQEHQAINLSQGFPDFPLEEGLVDLLREAAASGFNQYAPMPGLLQLREAIAADLQKRYALHTDPVHEITITPGATYAIYTALSAILQAGDEVIILEPAYDSYIPNIQMLGAKAVPVALRAPDFRVDWDQVKAAISRATRAILVNTPHNPTGTTWDRSDWQQLATLIRDTDIVVVSDEVYEQLVYDGTEHYSVLQHPELRQRSFALYSFGKVFHNTGWKTGYCIAPEAYTRSFRRLHQFLAFSVNTPAQYALASYLQQDRIPVNRLLEQKRNYFLDLMRQTPFTALAPAAGSYFQLFSYEGLSKLDEHSYARMLTSSYGVATIPVSAFYSNRNDQKLLRFCFAKKEATLEAAAERLRLVQPE